MGDYVTLRSVLLRHMPNTASSHWIEQAVLSGRWPEIVRGPNRAHMAPESMAQEILEWAQAARTVRRPTCPAPSHAPSQPPETERHLTLSLGPGGVRIDDTGPGSDSLALEIGRLTMQIHSLIRQRDQLLEQSNAL